MYYKKSLSVILHKCHPIEKLRNETRSLDSYFSPSPVCHSQESFKPTLSSPSTLLSLNSGPPSWTLGLGLLPPWSLLPVHPLQRTLLLGIREWCHKQCCPPPRFLGSLFPVSSDSFQITSFIFTSHPADNTGFPIQNMISLWHGISYLKS